MGVGINFRDDIEAIFKLMMFESEGHGIGG